MEENSAMVDKFQALLNTDKKIVISQFGCPAFSFPSFAVYSKSGAWMVLHFYETKNGFELRSQLKAISFFDSDLRLLWSAGIDLLPSRDFFSGKNLSSVRELESICGVPHGEIGGGRTALMYLTEDGYFLFLNCFGEEVIRISQASLPELAKHFEGLAECTSSP